MVSVLLYAIINEEKVMEQWCHPKKQKRLRGFTERVVKKVLEPRSITIRSVQMDGLWVYYFHQESFIFILGADGLERSARMQNYLRVLTQIFYENYDEKNFPTVMNRIITEINRIEDTQSTAEEHEGLVNGYSMVNEKQRLGKILLKKDRESRRAYMVSAILFICIVILGIYYLKSRG